MHRALSSTLISLYASALDLEPAADQSCDNSRALLPVEVRHDLGWTNCLAYHFVSVSIPRTWRTVLRAAVIFLLAFVLVSSVIYSSYPVTALQFKRTTTWEIRNRATLIVDPSPLRSTESSQRRYSMLDNFLEEQQDPSRVQYARRVAYALADKVSYISTVLIR